MAVQTGAAHAACLAQGLDPQPRVGVVANPFDRTPDPAEGPLGPGDMAQQAPLRSLQETIEQFPLRHRRQNRNVARRVEQRQQAQQRDISGGQAI